MKPLTGFGLTLVIGAVVALLLLGVPGSELPLPDIVRDVIAERQVAEAAIGGADWRMDNPRTPGAALLALPWLVASNHLEWWAASVSVVSLGLIVSGTMRLSPVSFLAGIVLCVALPASAAVMQALFHGSTFLPVAAAVVWAWVWTNSRPVVAGVLLGVAGVARLWPLLVVFAWWPKRRAAYATATTTVLLTIVGLALPGVGLANSIGGLIGGGETWIATGHNGSIAAWLPIPPLAAVVAGGLIVLVVWWLRLRHLADVDDRVDWTLPLAILASPLAWLPYLLVLTPVVIRVRRAVWVSALAVVVQLIGWRWIGQSAAITLTCLAVAVASLVHAGSHYEGSGMGNGAAGQARPNREEISIDKQLPRLRA